jgi:hypothetical protein
VREPGARRSTDDGDDQLVAQRGLQLEQTGGGAHQHARSLERLDPADEQQQVRVVRDAERAAGRRLRAG